MNDFRRHSIATDDVSVLSRLIDHAIFAVSMRPNPEQGLLNANTELVRAASMRPAEGARVIDDHTLMCAQAICLADRAMRTHARGSAIKYVHVIGALLPYVREDLSLALENRKARPSS